MKSSTRILIDIWISGFCGPTIFLPFQESSIVEIHYLGDRKRKILTNMNILVVCEDCLPLDFKIQIPKLSKQKQLPSF